MQHRLSLLGAVGWDRRPHCCLRQASQPLPPPSPATQPLSPTLLRLHPLHLTPPCPDPPHGQQPGAPKCHLGTGAGMRLELLGSLCLQGGCSQPCQEPFCDQLCLAGGLGNPSWLWGEVGTASLAPPGSEGSAPALPRGWMGRMRPGTTCKPTGKKPSQFIVTLIFFYLVSLR